MKPRVGAVLLAVAVMILMLGSAALAPVGTATAPASSGGTSVSSTSPASAGVAISPTSSATGSASQTFSVSVAGSNVAVGSPSSASPFVPQASSVAPAAAHVTASAASPIRESTPTVDESGAAYTTAKCTSSSCYGSGQTWFTLSLTGLTANDLLVLVVTDINEQSSHHLNAHDDLSGTPSSWTQLPGDHYYQTWSGDSSDNAYVFYALDPGTTASVTVASTSSIYLDSSSSASAILFALSGVDQSTPVLTSDSDYYPSDQGTTSDSGIHTVGPGTVGHSDHELSPGDLVLGVLGTANGVTVGKGGSGYTQITTEDDSTHTLSFVEDYAITTETTLSDSATVSGDNHDWGMIGLVVNPAPSPTLTAVPDSGPIGSQISVTGSNYPSGTNYACFAATADAGDYCGHTGTTGTVSFTPSSGNIPANTYLTVPSSDNDYVITSQSDSSGTSEATDAFTVTTPAISLSPTSGPVGTTVMVSGSGFNTGDSSLTLASNPTNDWITSGYTCSISGGTITSCSFTVASGTTSPFTVTATGSGGSGDHATSGSFTVTVPTLSVSPNFGTSITTTNDGPIRLSGSLYATGMTYYYCFEPATLTGCSNTYSFLTGAGTAIPTGPGTPKLWNSLGSNPPAGTTQVVVSTTSGTVVATAPFTVTSVTASAGAVGEHVTLTGSGYYPKPPDTKYDPYYVCFQATSAAGSCGNTYKFTSTDGTIPSGTTILVPNTGNSYIAVYQNNYDTNDLVAITSFTPIATYPVTFELSGALSGASGTVVTYGTAATSEGCSDTANSIAYSSFTGSPLSAPSIEVTSGDYVCYAYDSPLSGGSGVQYAWYSTGGTAGQTGQSATFEVTSAGTVEATYVKQYQVTLQITARAQTDFDSGMTLALTGTVDGVSNVALCTITTTAAPTDSCPAQVWVDSGGTVNFPQYLSSPPAHSQWQNAAGASSLPTVSSSTTINVNYYKQWDATFTIVPDTYTAANGGFDSGLSLEITGPRLGTGENLCEISSGAGGQTSLSCTAYIDNGGSASFAGALTGAGPNIRWLNAAGTGGSSEAVTSASPASVTYYKQWHATFTITPDAYTVAHGGFDASLSLEIAGPQLGTNDPDICTISSGAGGQTSLSCTGYIDNGGSASFAQFLGGTPPANVQWQNAAGTGGSSETVTSASPSSVTYYKQWDATFTITPVNVADFDSGLSLEITGTYLGVSTPDLCEIGPTGGSDTAASCEAYIDNGGSASFAQLLTGAGTDIQWQNAAGAASTETVTSASPTSVSYYKQVSETVSYSISDVSSGDTAPTLDYTYLGSSSATYTMTTTPTPVWLDYDTGWTATPNPLTGSTSSERWDANSGTSGTSSAGGTINPEYYHQYHPTLQITAEAQATFDAGMTLALTGTQFGVSGAALCTITTTAATTDSCQAWVDNGGSVTFAQYLTNPPVSSRWQNAAGAATAPTVSSASTVNVNYYKQVSETVSYSISDVSSGYTAPTLDYTYLGSSGATYTMTATPTMVWLDYGTSWTATPNPLTGSDSNQRWDANSGTSGTSSAGGTINPEYYHQYYVSTSYSTSDGPAIPGVDGSVGLTAVQFGNSITPTLTTTATSVWLDAGTTWTVSPNILPASPTNERWDANNVGLTGAISSLTTISPEYWHQFKVSFAYTTVDGTTIASGTDLVSYTQFGAPLTLTTTATYGVLSLSSDWADATTSVTYVSPVSVSANERYAIASTDTGTHTVIASVSASTLSADPEYAFHQFLVIFDYSLVGSGSPTAPTVQYTEFNTVHTTTAALSSGPSAWVDVGTTVKYTNPLGTSDGTHRWQVDLPIIGGLSTVGSPVASGETLNPSYYEQWDVSFAYTTSDGTTIASGTGLASYTQFGSALTLTTTGTYGALSSTSDWADVGTQVTYNSPVSIPSNGRYMITSTDTGTETIIASVSVASLSADPAYFHQFYVSFAYTTSDSTTLPSGTLVSYTYFGTGQSLTTTGTYGLLSKTSDWVDAATAVTYNSPITISSTEQYAIAPADSGTHTVIASVGESTLSADPEYFHQYEVTFAVTPSGGGTTTPTSISWVNAGPTGNAIVATPTTGWVFNDWTSTGSITFTSSTSASTTAYLTGTGTITAHLFEVALSSYTGHVGDTRTLTAGGFAGNTLYSLCFDPTFGTQSTYCVQFTTVSDGSFSGPITIPNVPNGAYYVEAWTTDPSFVVAATTQFTIGVTASLGPTSGTFGSTPTLTASGLTANTEYWVCFDASADTQSSYCASFTTGAGGSYSGTITIPSMPGGTYDHQEIWTAAPGGVRVIPVTGSFAMDPSASLNPTSGTHGSTAMLTVQGLAANTEYWLCFDSATETQSGYCVSFTTGSDGSFNGLIAIPSMPGGTYDAEVWSAASSGTFEVATPTPFTMNPSVGALNPTSGTYASTVTLTAYGLTPGTEYWVCFDGVVETQSPYCTSFTVTASDGSYNGPITIPNMPGGPHLVEVWSAASSGTFEAAAPTPFTMDPSLSALSPSSGVYGGTPTVSAHGLAANTEYWVCFDTSSEAQSSYCASFTTGSDGSFSGPISVPSMPGGSYHVEVWSAASSGTFEVSTATPFTMNPTVSLSPDSGGSGSTPTLTVYGLAADTEYWVCFDTSSQAQSSYCVSFTTGSDGSFSGPISIPGMPGGTYNVEVWSAASGGTFEVAASNPFTMGATASLTPDSGMYGDTPTLTANGLAADTEYWVCFDTSSEVQSTYCTSFTTGSDGSYMGPITIPSMPAGTYDFVEIWTAVSGGAFVVQLPGAFTMVSSATITPASGPGELPTGHANTQITVTAYGLAADTTYTVYFDQVAGTAYLQSTTPSATFTTDANGYFTGQFDAPGGLTTGESYFVDIWTSTGTFVVSATPEFQVTPLVVTVSSTSGAPGPVTLTATGLSPDMIYFVYLDTTQGVASSASYNPIGTCTTDGSGALTGGGGDAPCTFVIPSGLSPGTYYVDLFQDPTAPPPYIVLLYSFTVASPPPPPPSAYSVIFTETGLASGTSWSVTLNGVTELGTGSSIVFTGMSNGVYGFSVRSVSGYTVSPATGSVTVNGADVSQPVTFTAIGPPPSTYTLTFTETGMPPGAGGGIAFNGARLTAFGAGGVLSFSGLVNGSYSFTISAGAGYRLVSSTPSSPVTVNGAGVTVSVVFEAVYSITFSETGLLSGTSWSVTLSGATQTGTGSSIAFPSLANASYAFSVGTVSGYTVSPATGSMTVSGADLSQAITFTPIAPPPSTYTVTFTATGLTTGTSWSVTLNGVTQSGASSSIAFRGMVNGSYTFSVGTVSGYTASPAAGSMNVNGADLNQAITYAPSTYTVTFTETGLTAGTTWSVTLNGVTLTGASASIAFTAMLDGTYTFTVGAVSGYTVSPATGPVTVSDANLTQVIVFTPITPPPPTTYTVTFTETGLTAGTSWSVTFDGSTLSANAPASVVFSGVQNGTYTYTVGAVSGYSSTPSAGVPTTTSVSGGAVTAGVTFASASVPAPLPLYAFALIAVVIAAIVVGTLVLLVARRRKKKEPEEGSTERTPESPAPPPSSGGSGGGVA